MWHHPVISLSARLGYKKCQSDRNKRQTWTYLDRNVNVGSVVPWQKTSSRPEKGSYYAKQPTRPSSINTGEADSNKSFQKPSQFSECSFTAGSRTFNRGAKSLAIKPHTMQLAPFQAQQDDSLSKMIILWGG